MGIFDSIKNVFGSSAEKDETVSPSQILRAAGVDPTGLKFGFHSDGSISVSGQIDNESERQTILDTLAGAPAITRVEDKLTITVAQVPDAVTAESPADDAGSVTPAVETDAVVAQGAKTYTVQSGDTLWKISEDMYGDGSKYMKIFEANSGLLEHPDRIFPAQELVIPELDD
jgi:nucleoid-associated protein YgaU